MTDENWHLAYTVARGDADALRAENARLREANLEFGRDHGEKAAELTRLRKQRDAAIAAMETAEDVRDTLLAALREHWDIRGRLSDSGKSWCVGCYRWMADCSARAAIAKAEGEMP